VKERTWNNFKIASVQLVKSGFIPALCKYRDIYLTNDFKMKLDQMKEQFNN